jgi:hypothetical protein
MDGTVESTDTEIKRYVKLEIEGRVFVYGCSRRCHVCYVGKMCGNPQMTNGNYL